MRKKWEYNPGSDEALKRGCRCAVLDNAHGKGYFGMKGVFVMTADCPLHGFEDKPPRRKPKKQTKG